MIKTFSTALVVAALALTSACGGGDDARPTQDEIKKVLEKDNNILGPALSDKVADCAASVFADSDVSDQLLQDLVANKKNASTPSAADQKAYSATEDDLRECLDIDN